MIRFWIDAKTKINVPVTSKSSVPSFFFFRKMELYIVGSILLWALKFPNYYEKAIWGVVEKGKTKFRNKTFWKFLVQAIVEFRHLLHLQTFWIKRRRWNEKKKKSRLLTNLNIMSLMKKLMLFYIKKWRTSKRLKRYDLFVTF